MNIASNGDEFITTRLFNVCRSVFKTKAEKIRKALVAAGHRVSVNESKPRRGAFVISIVGKEEPEVELLGLKRPFQPLRELDLDKTIADLIEKTKA